MLKILLSATILLQMYSLEDTNSSLLQGLALLPLILASVFVVFSKMEQYYYLNGMVLMLCLALPVQSLLVVGILSQGDTTYTLIYALTAISLMSLCQYAKIEDVTEIYIFSMLAFAISIFFFDMESVNNALYASVDIGSNRLSSFGNHPNLLGHTFGMALSFSFYKFLFAGKNNFWRTAYFFFSVVFLFLLLMTSSRGSLLSFIVVVFIFVCSYLSDELRKGNSSKAFSFIFALIILVSYFIFKYFDFIINILDLNSFDRGLGSGFTGRGGNWIDILYIVTSDFTLSLFGGGFRSWSDLKYGFATDSSYLNLLYEFGVITSILAIFSIIVALYKVRPVRVDKDYNLLFIILMYSVVEGIFARYLIAIGNPASLLILFAIFTVYSDKK